MPRRFVNQLSDGESVEEIFLLADKQLRANRNANLYLLAHLRDRTGIINGLMWNMTEAQVAPLNPGAFVKVKVYQGAMQMILAHIQPVPPEGLDPADFHAATDGNVEQMLGRLKQLLLVVEEP